MRSWILLAASFLQFMAGPAVAAGDAKRGAQLFQQCMACHSTEPGEHLTGPSLAHVWSRKAGTAERACADCHGDASASMRPSALLTSTLASIDRPTRKG